MDYFQINLIQFLGITLSAITIFVLMLVIIRFHGLRSFAKMSAHDFGVTIAIGSILGATIVNEKPTVLQGALAIFVILSCQSLYSIWRRKRDDNYLDNQPILLMKGETILYDNLKKSKISVNDLYSKLREANVTHVNQVHAVVLEASGDMSVLHSTNEYTDDILRGVKQED